MEEDRRMIVFTRSPSSHELEEEQGQSHLPLPNPDHDKKRKRNEKPPSPRKRWKSSENISPPFKLDTIQDLLYLAWNYRGDLIDWFTLWKLIPSLTELNAMVGLENLKQSVIDIILTQIQGLRDKKDGGMLHTVLYGPPGVGKCLAKDTLIMMYDGTTKMVQNIKTGESLMGDDSSPRVVLSTTTGTEMMYEIRQKYGENYTVNESHVLSLKLSKNPRIRDRTDRSSFIITWFTKDSVLTKTFSYKTIPKEEVRIGVINFAEGLPKKGSVIDVEVREYLKRNKSWKAAYKGYKVGIDYPYRKVGFDPYILGVWLGDGTKSKPQITTTDMEIIDYIKTVFPALNVRSNKTGITYDITSHKDSRNNSNESCNPFRAYLREYNLLNNKHIPKDYLFNSREIRLSLLAGLIDSDGYYNVKSCCYEIIQKRKGLVDDIIWLCRSLGFKSNMNECIKSCKYKEKTRYGTYYRIHISGNIEDIPSKLKRKIARKRISNKNHLVYEIKVIPKEKDTYYGFEIDNNRRFLLGDFTVTHNTTCAHILAKIYCNMGFLTTDSVVIAKRSDFVKKWTGHSDAATMELLRSALGGVLFIDEAYCMGNKDKVDDFAKAAVDLLNQFLSEHADNFICIVAGYEDDLDSCFFSINEGLKSRFPKTFHLEKYSPGDLLKMFKNRVKKEGWRLAESSANESFFSTNKDAFPSYGRDIENFLNECKSVHARRICGTTEEKKLLTKEDIDKGLQKFLRHRKKEDTRTDTSHMYT